MEDFKKKFNLESIEARLKFHEQNDSLRQKNSQWSIDYRKKGNSLYLDTKKHNEVVHKNILEIYNKCIAVAIENSEEQALAFSNRSVLLMHFKKYKKCLVDISRAYKITQSNDLKKKLDNRKEKCLTLIKIEDKKDDTTTAKADDLNLGCEKDNAFYEFFMRDTFGIGFFERTEKKMLYPKSVEFKDIEINKLKLHKPESINKMMPNFSDSLELKYNFKFGRHIVATKDIRPGEVLSVESGLVFPKIDATEFVCSHCLNYMWSGIPCPSCCFAQYCSEKCKSKAWVEYHDVECSILPAIWTDIAKGLIDPKSYTNELLAYRLFIKLVKSEGLENVLSQAKSMNNNQNAHIKGFLNDDGKFDINKFKVFYNLLNHSDIKKKNNEEFSSEAILILSKYAKYFKDFNDFTYEHLVEIKNLISKLKSILDCNACTFQDLDSIWDELEDDFTILPQEGLGMMIAPCSSLFNHSCYPNAFSVFCKNGKKVMFAARRIKKDEQVFITYGPNLNMEVKERQAYLKKHYNFTCQCPACKNNWTMKFDPEKYIMNNMTAYQKLMEELFEYREKLRSKKVNYKSLAYITKYIEIADKYLKDHGAAMFMDPCIKYMRKFLCKLYATEMRIPKTC